VELGPADATLLGVAPDFVSWGAAGGWHPLLKEAIALPVSSPSYPASPGPEDLEPARALARSRVHYGAPTDAVRDPVPIPTTGTVTIARGSSLVTGSGTSFAPTHAGAVLSVDGHASAYVIARVLSPTRLVLTRQFADAGVSGAGYQLATDPFGQLHD